MMAALVVPASALDNRRVVNWTVEVDSGLATFERSVVATSAVVDFSYHIVYYQALFDEDDVYPAYSSVAVFGAAQYARNFGFFSAAEVHGFSIPLIPEHRVYLVNSRARVNGAYEVNQMSLIVNDAARVVVEQDEPMPVRLAELGANGTMPSEVPSTGVPVSLEASVVLSLDESGTVPVSVKSVGWLDSGALTTVAVLLVLVVAFLFGALALEWWVL